MLVLLFVIGLIICFTLDNIDGIYKHLILGAVLVVGLILYFIPSNRGGTYKHFISPHSHGSNDFDGGDPGGSDGGV